MLDFNLTYPVKWSRTLLIHSPYGIQSKLKASMGHIVTFCLKIKRAKGAESHHSGLML